LNWQDNGKLSKEKIIFPRKLKLFYEKSVGEIRVLGFNTHNDSTLDLPKMLLR
jgi:hypothetical protein